MYLARTITIATEASVVPMMANMVARCLSQAEQCLHTARHTLKAQHISSCPGQTCASTSAFQRPTAGDSRGNWPAEIMYLPLLYLRWCSQLTTRDKLLFTRPQRPWRPVCCYCSSQPETTFRPDVTARVVPLRTSRGGRGVSTLQSNSGSWL